MAQTPPQDLQIIGDMLAIVWSDGREDVLSHELLRAESPSALNKGEHDIFGNKYGGDDKTEFPGVRITGWQYIGNYAVCLHFSDGHNSGIYSWKLLRHLGDEHSQ